MATKPPTKTRAKLAKIGSEIEKRKQEGREFTAAVKSALALRGETQIDLAARIGKHPTVVNRAISSPWERPLVVALIKSDLGL